MLIKDHIAKSIDKSNLTTAMPQPELYSFRLLHKTHRNNKISV